MVEELQQLAEATGPRQQTTFVLRLFDMGYERDLFRWMDSLPPYRSNFDPGGYPAQGYVHRHGGNGDRHPKALRKKRRNRKGRFAE